MTSESNDQRFLSVYRVKRGADFQRAYKRRCVASDAVLVVYVCENGLPHARLGLSVSRKVGPAVTRNRWKRLLRESFRLERQQLPEGLDLIVIPRPEVEPDLGDLRRALIGNARRAASKLSRRGPPA